MRYLIAFDKFKGSMTAQQACAVVEDRIDAARPGSEVELAPITDGGEGFVEIVTRQVGGSLRSYRVTYPDLTQGDAWIGYISLKRLSQDLRDFLKLPETGLLAILEMAQSSGYQLIRDTVRNPWIYGTQGVGDMIRYAMGEGAQHILLGMGGSATNDMGVGMLESLGMRAFNSEGEIVSPLIPVNWNKIATFHLPDFPNLNVKIACDVDNPLHGDNGAAAVFGPQKGLIPEDLPNMQEAMLRTSESLLAASDKSIDFNTPGMGAAGGLPYGLFVAFESSIVPGFDTIALTLDLERKVQSADIIITGEGSLDRSSLAGKGPYEIIRLAAKYSKETWVFAGKVDTDVEAKLLKINPNLKAIPIGNPEISLEINLQKGEEHLANHLETILAN